MALIIYGACTVITLYIYGDYIGLFEWNEWSVTGRGEWDSQSKWLTCQSTSLSHIPLAFSKRIKRPNSLLRICLERVMKWFYRSRGVPQRVDTRREKYKVRLIKYIYYSLIIFTELQIFVKCFSSNSAHSAVFQLNVTWCLSAGQMLVVSILNNALQSINLATRPWHDFSFDAAAMPMRWLSINLMKNL